MAIKIWFDDPSILFNKDFKDELTRKSVESDLINIFVGR